MVLGSQGQVPEIEVGGTRAAMENHKDRYRHSNRILSACERQSMQPARLLSRAGCITMGRPLKAFFPPLAFGRCLYKTSPFNFLPNAEWKFEW
jgi:hypothetical protein